MQKAEETKERANQLYKEKKYDEALILFKEASNYINKLNTYTPLLNLIFPVVKIESS